MNSDFFPNAYFGAVYFDTGFFGTTNTGAPGDMFGDRYFANKYFANGFFGPTTGETPEPPVGLIPGVTINYRTHMLLMVV